MRPLEVELLEERIEVGFVDEEIGLSEPILGIDPSECDGKHPRTWDNCCHGCGTRIIPHPKGFR